MNKLRFVTILTIWAMLCIACNAILDDEPQMANVSVQLRSDNAVLELGGVEVELADVKQTTYTAQTDETGVAHFCVPLGFYSATAQTIKNQGNIAFVANGYKEGIALLSEEDFAEELLLVTSSRSRVLLKEIYVGGCPMDDGSGDFAYDKYVILYNNTAERVEISNFGIACLPPYNSNATNNFYTTSGELSYATDDYVPIAQVLWYLPKNLEIEPYGQKVIACNSAINCTLTYSQSVDLSYADYVTYDNTFTTHTKSHPVPDASIPTENYLRAIQISSGNGWALSKLSPAIVIFSCGDLSPQEVANNPDNEVFHGAASAANRCLKIRREWVLDGVEVFDPSYSNNRKRLTSDIDAGHVDHTAHQGFSLYRNVDVAATMAVEGNAEKLVFGYGGEAEQIDAEASAKNGAKIIYQDTNNSGNDFHLRSRASLKER